MDKCQDQVLNTKLGLKVVRCLFKEEFLNLVLQIFLKLNIKLLILNSLQKLVDAKLIKDQVLNADDLKKLGLVSSSKKPVKILGKGDIKIKIQVRS